VKKKKGWNREIDVVARRLDEVSPPPLGMWLLQVPRSQKPGAPIGGCLDKYKENVIGNKQDST